MLALHPELHTCANPRAILTSEVALGPFEPLRYSPRELASLLARWRELLALAEDPATARGLHHPTEPTRESFRPRLRRRTPTDRLRWADVVADIEQAHTRLRHGGDFSSWLLVQLRLDGRSVSQIAQLLGLPTRETHSTYDRALRAMAHSLGWSSTTGIAPSTPPPPPASSSSGAIDLL